MQKDKNKSTENPNYKQTICIGTVGNKKQTCECCSRFSNLLFLILAAARSTLNLITCR
ncbi:MAG: hypothetical protein ACI90V_003611, partial [Bacillariaceae sp.]